MKVIMDIIKLNELASACMADPELFQFAVDAKTWMQETIVDRYISMDEAFAIAQTKLYALLVTICWMRLKQNYIVTQLHYQQGIS